MIQTFRPEFFFYQPIPNHEHHKQILLPKLEEDRQRAHQNNNGAGITTYGEANFNLFHDEFVLDVIWNPFNQMVKEFNFKPFQFQKSKVRSIWWNYYDPYEVCNPHRHHRSDFTGIYLLHLEEPNPTKFLPSNDSPFINGPVSSTQCIEGDVLIFLGSILHWTSPIKTPRWVIVFDIDLFN